MTIVRTMSPTQMNNNAIEKEAQVSQIVESKSTMSEEERTRQLWRIADAVCFDVDSTVCTTECIDELAAFKDVGERVAAVTRQAMGGTMSFREALIARLDLIRPSRSDIQSFLRNNPPKLTPGIADLISLLHSRGTSVYLVSGGFMTLIEPVAQQLHIPMSNIYANVLQFAEDGSYAGFDVEQPTSASGGKAVVCARILQQHRHKCLIVVGDGATDIEAAPPAHAAIGFGGNIVRQTVIDKCGWFVHSFDKLIAELSQS